MSRNLPGPSALDTWTAAAPDAAHPGPKALAKPARPLVSFLVEGMSWAATAFRSCLIAAMVMAWAVRPAAGKDPWWDMRWPYRRAVTVADVPKAAAEGDEVGVLTMPTGGLILPDGRDIRLATARGQPLAGRVLMVGPGDQVRVAFALRQPHTKYYAYFGNPKPPEPSAGLEIRRGVLLEMWEYRGGGIATLAEVRRAFARAGKLIGRDFRTDVFLGHNPFGPQNRTCSLFTGHLLCPETGEYTFSTSSRDASFLLIDEKVVVRNGGSHPPQRRAARQGKVTLTRGAHELKVYHVNTFADPVVVAAWKTPNGRRLWKIPPGAFAPIRRASPGGLERYGREREVDFIPVHAGETFMANGYFQRYAFEALLTGRAAGGAEFQWDFGDGQKASGGSCQHVYLRNGPFKVALTARVGGQALTRANTIYVARPWDRVTANVLDPLSAQARIVAGYDFAAADPIDLGGAIALFERAGLTDAILKAGDALLKRDKAPGAALRDAVPVYAATLVAVANDPPRAVAALLKAAEMTPDPAVRATLTVQAGQTALNADDADKALEIFQYAVKKYAALTSASIIRDARIGIGDVHRLRGDYAKALAAYRSARPLRRSSFEKEVVRQGDLARHVEDYIRRGMYHDAADSLDLWEREFPVDKLAGYSTLLRVRLARARKQHARAAAEAETLVRVNPSSNYAPDLLMSACRAYEALGQDAQARRTLQRIIKSYPESPLAGEARKQLGAK